MSIVGKFGAVAMLALALSVAACTSTSSTSPTTSTRPSSTSLRTTSTAKRPVGVVTGTAEPCTGPPSLPIPHVVKIRLYFGKTLVASQTVRAGARYRFSVAPGRYEVTGWWGSEAVVVRAGRVVIFNIEDWCM